MAAIKQEQDDEGETDHNGVSVATILALASPVYAVNLGGGAIGGFGGTLGGLSGGVAGGLGGGAGGLGAAGGIRLSGRRQ